jgi:subtilase family serine protease
MPNPSAAPGRTALLLCSLFLFVCIPAFGYAQAADLVHTPVNSVNRVTLTGHHPAWANPRNDAGSVPADLAMNSLTLVLARSPQTEQAYAQFLQDQQNPASPNYHHWLTPVEVGQRFGVSAHDIQAVTTWLQSHGLRVDSISNSRDRIIFSGRASAVSSAFGAEIHYFSVNGETRISVAADPQIPVALGKVVKSVSGLYTFKLHPQYQSKTVHLPPLNMASDPEIVPEATISTGDYVIFPADFAVIYDLNSVPSGINGAGQTIAVVARSRVCAEDITNFDSLAGVTINLVPANGIVPPGGVDPGAAACTQVTSPNPDQGEATLDVTRSGSIAQGANIALIISADTATEDGIQIDTQYVVDTNPVLAQIMNISFGGCESQAGASGVQYWDSLFKQAAAEGISVFVSSGDSAAAGCDTAFTTPPANQILSPNSVCSSSYATCVGGTEFADTANPTQYWSPTNGANFESAISYIPEGAWNEPLDGTKPVAAGTGGGVSAFIATPTWQVGTGVPTARAGRYTPDVAFSASAHDGYFGCEAAEGGDCVVTKGSFAFLEFSGTSAAAPDMAGIAALVNQKEGSAQGTLNPGLYNLAATPTNNVFNDVTVATSAVSNCVVTTPSMCNNSTAGTTGLTGGLSGYLVTAGYDEATGLGSINVANLLTNWISTTVATTTKLTSLAPTSVNAGSSGPVVITAAVTSSGGTPTGNVNFFNGNNMIGTAPLTNGTATFNYNPSALAGGTYSITASYPWNSSFGNSTSTPQTLNVQGFKISASPTTIAVTAPGQTGSTTLTVIPLGGFNQSVSYSCSGLPSEATCTFAAASATSETLTITTTGPSASLDKIPSRRSRTLFYALMLPGFLGLMFSTGKKSRCALRLLSFVAVLSLAALWMPACGGGGGTSTQSNPGTPVGTSTVTITATAGSLTAPPTIVTLSVQ